MNTSVDADGSDEIDSGAGIDTHDASGLGLPPAYVDLTTGLAKVLVDTDTLTSIERVLGSGQDDTLIGLTGADSLSGGSSDRLLGSDGNDSLFAGDGNDRLVGDAGRDVLNGGAGTDAVRGRLDIDFMTSGTGSDRFVWTDYQDFLPTALNPAAGIDRVTDFTQGQDQIDLSAIDALATGLDDAFVFAGTGALTALGQISYRTTATTTIISISFDAIQGFDVIRLDGVIALTAADFVL